MLSRGKYTYLICLTYAVLFFMVSASNFGATEHSPERTYAIGRNKVIGTIVNKIYFPPPPFIGLAVNAEGCRLMPPCMKRLKLGIAILLFNLPSAFAGVTPPENFTDTPPHLTATIGASSLLEYRDVLIKSAFSGNVAATGTYRGFTLSASGAQPFSSGRFNASELVATYSHKLPFVDLHMGMVYCRIDRPTTTECGDLRVALSTNTFRSTRVDINADVSPFGKGHILSIGISQRIKETEFWTFELKGSATTWNRNNFDANGWSLRLLGMYRISPHLGIHGHLGFLQSWVNNPGIKEEANGIVAGVNAIWTF